MKETINFSDLENKTNSWLKLKDGTVIHGYFFSSTQNNKYEYFVAENHRNILPETILAGAISDEKPNDEDFKEIDWSKL